jgi:hypothetical protein
MRLKTRTSDAGSTQPDSPYRARSSSAAWRDRGAGGAGEEEEEEEVAGDPMMVAQQMGRVNQEHAEVERAAEQVRAAVSGCFGVLAACGWLRVAAGLIWHQRWMFVHGWCRLWCTRACR